MLNTEAICFNCQTRCSLARHHSSESVNTHKENKSTKASEQLLQPQCTATARIFHDPCGTASRLLFLPHAEHCSGNFNNRIDFSALDASICCCLLTLRDEKCPKNISRAQLECVAIVCRDLRPLRHRQSSPPLHPSLSSTPHVVLILF